MKKHEFFGQYLTNRCKDSVFIEIGGERGEGSTPYLARLAKQYSATFFSVDIDQKSLEIDLQCRWQEFYPYIRDESWPEFCRYVTDLNPDLQIECYNLHNWKKFEDEIKLKWQDVEKNDVQWITEVGSIWSKNYKTLVGKSISLLYLDNFDYIWDKENIPLWMEKQINWYADRGIAMNNQNCQVEHFTQLINLYPYLSSDCLIGLDDTYTWNDCWVGKSGPGVIFLMSNGWKIIHNSVSDKFVIMSRI